MSEMICACCDAINELIVDGPLLGNGTDKTAERNGLILAFNLLSKRSEPTVPMTKGETIMRRVEAIGMRWIVIPKGFYDDLPRTHPQRGLLLTRCCL